jgi:hypothetical protein
LILFDYRYARGTEIGMSDTPKFEVIDRRKFKAEHEEEVDQQARSATEAAATLEEAKPEPARPETSSGGPRLVVNEASTERAIQDAGAAPGQGESEPAMGEPPPAPTAAESQEQKTAYDGASQRLEDLIRAQNPAMGAQPPVTFESLIQQFYLSAMIQMGAGTEQGQRPRVDILGARTTIDLLGVLAEKTKGNLTDVEDKMLQSVLFECRMAFMELTSMITLQGMQPPAPPPPGKR